MLDTYEAVRAEFEAMCDDVRADYGDEGDELLDGGAARDLVVAACFNATDGAARELCRTELGYVPDELVARLGNLDADAGEW